MVGRFGRILGRSAKSSDLRAGDDAAGFIRDLSRLTEREVEAAKILDVAHKDIWPDPDANRYTERFAALMRSVQEGNIERDDFYSRCLKLGGFGLVIEVERNTSRMAPSEHCFRLTSRGHDLLDLIRESPSPALGE